MKKLALLMLVVAVCMVVSAVAISVYAAPVTIKVATWYGSEGKVWPELEALARAFEKENPGIKVEMQFRPGAEYGRQQLLDVAAGTGPDIYYYYNDSEFYARAGKGMFLDLTPYIKRDKYDQVLIKGMVDAQTVGGKVYAMPLGNAATIVYYFKDRLKEAGVAAPRKGWDWNDLLSMGKKLLKKNDAGQWLYPFAVDADGALLWGHSWEVQMKANGGSLWTDDQKRSALGETASRQTLQFVSDAIRQRVVPEFPIGRGSNWPGERFGPWTGAAMAQVHMGLVLDLWVRILGWKTSEVQEKIGVVQAPGSPNTKRTAATVIAHILEGNAKTKHPNEVWEFMKFWASYRPWVELEVLKWGQISSVKSQATWGTDVMLEVTGNLEPVLQASAMATPMFYLDDGAKFDSYKKAMGDVWPDFATGRLSVDEFVTTFDKKANAILGK